MMDFINKARAEGVPLKQAVIESGTLRFRAIVLTSMTTAGGLLPIMFERAAMAQIARQLQKARKLAGLHNAGHGRHGLAGDATAAPAGGADRAALRLARAKRGGRV